MIDTHCHLADKQFARDLPAVIARAKAQGVWRMITIADSIPESRRCIAITREHADVFCAVGVHPHHAKDWKEEDKETLRSLAASSSAVRAIGEIGLDYHYDFSPRDRQRSVFRAQLEIAREAALPVVVHCRDAVADVRSALLNHDLRRVVLHCCTEAWKDIAELVEAGLRLSFTGIATYPTADAIREVIRLCPMEQLMVETDAPYLPPEALRAKGGRAVRNEPAYVLEVARLIAAIKGISLEEVDRETTQNAVAFFGLPS